MHTEITIPSQLIFAIKSAVREAMKEAERPWLTIDDMCHRFGKSKSTIYAMVNRHQIPPSTCGRWPRRELEDRGL
jgi:predicted DNA-binding transcriptional regulator AlpA